MLLTALFDDAGRMLSATVPLSPLVVRAFSAFDIGRTDFF